MPRIDALPPSFQALAKDYLVQWRLLPFDLQAELIAEYGDCAFDGWLMRVLTCRRKPTVFSTAAFIAFDEVRHAERD